MLGITDIWTRKVKVANNKLVWFIWWYCCSLNIEREYITAMSYDASLVKNKICSWIYIKYVFLDHLSIFLTIYPLTPLIERAITRLTSNKCDPTWVIGKPYFDSPRSATATLTILVVGVGIPKLLQPPNNCNMYRLFLT